MITDDNLLHAAYFIANTEMRYRRNNNHYDADRAHNRLVDAVESATDPYGVLDRLIRRLGRQRSIEIAIDREVIDLALTK